MWVGNLLPFDRFQRKNNNYNLLCEIPGNYATTILTDSRQKNNYNYVRGYLLPIDRFQTKTIITIMWVGNLLPFDRWQTKKLISIARGQFSTFWQIPDKKLQLCERANYYLLTDSRQIW